MKNLLWACVCFFLLSPAFAQTTKIKAEKYPSLLWEITGNGLRKPSYLFGTMHVSNKMVFHLSDSFYLGIRQAQVVALETNPGTWQEDFSRYDLDGEGMRYRPGRSYSENFNTGPQDFLTINSLKLSPYEKALEAALYSNPAMLNNFLYRSNADNAGDFEEDTYLDLHIFQAGRKLGKKICGVEDFHGSMQLVKEAYADAAKEKKKKGGYDYDNDLSYNRLEEAYRTGNLDLLDTINKVNSQSAAFDEKFLYKRNDIQAASIDSILKTGVTLFAGVGAAHLPGQRGVIEILRRLGYSLRPIKMAERDSHHKENLERIRVPVQFSRQSADDGLYSVLVPGKLYSFGKSYGGLDMKQFADMTNGSYYIVTRVVTNAAIQGQTESQVQRKLDSVLYESIPGKILLKKGIVKNGYRGYDITNRTRRGDLQRYQIFITPFEVLLFKMSGTGDYVKLGTEAEQFFSSIQLKEYKTEWKTWSPSYGGFEVDLPHQPVQFKGENTVFAALDAANRTAFSVVRTDIYNHDFLEEDSFDLTLMEESFAASENIARNLSKSWTKVSGYPALNARYRYKDSATAVVRFIIQGPHYYTLIATAPEENRWMNKFFTSFAIKPFAYGEATLQTDTLLRFTVQSPVALEKQDKLSLYGEEMYLDENSENGDDNLVENGTFRSRVVKNDSTGEKIHVAFFKHSPYFFSNGTMPETDSAAFKKEWTVRKLQRDTAKNGMVVSTYVLGNAKSSRLLKGRSFLKDGMGYTIESASDTLSKESDFIKTFFQTFTPLDSLQDTDINKKKTDLFFARFFSTDTLQRRKAVKNIGSVEMDSADFSPLQQAIALLSWKEKAYLPVKKNLIGKLAGMPTKEAADYLKHLYYKAGDTAELQYAVLETLLSQRTAYAYQTFAAILQDDPPVLDVTVHDRDYTTPVFRNLSWRKSGPAVQLTQNGYFFDNLRDSLLLTAGIFKSLLPLIAVDDYEQPVMALLRTLVDSALIAPADYEAYLPKFMLEAKQGLKKQLIREKAKAIEKAKKDEEEKESNYPYERSNPDDGNQKLSIYATLLLPFWDKNPQVEQIILQLLHSRDTRLRYNTALLLLRNNRPVPDSVIHAFAAMDEFRYELYTDLTTLGKEALFPTLYKTQPELARSRIVNLQTYGRPDTLVYLQKLPLQDAGHEGMVYFFKYKEKKDDNTWKIATAGLFPKDSTQLQFDTVKDNQSWDEDDFTRLTGTKLRTDITLEEQLEKIQRRLLYSRRKSAAQFYEEDGAYGSDDYLRMQ